MTGKQRRDPGIRLLGMVAGALAIWFSTLTFATLALARQPASSTLRAGIVGMAVAGFAVWVWVTGVSIRAQDEFSRRVHLVALSMAFGLTGLVVFTADFLQRAGFVGDIPLTGIWVVMVLAWWLCILIAARFYR
jgi:hypothetical protein